MLNDIMLISYSARDLSETVLESEPICSLVMDVQKHDNVKEVFQECIPFAQRTVGYEEIDWIPWYICSQFKSSRGSIKNNR